MSDLKKSRDPAITVRMPEQMLEDLEALRPLLKQHPAYRGVALSRSMLVRLAVSYGIEQLRQMLDDELLSSDSN